MPASEKIAEHILDQAADWLVTLHSGEVTDEQRRQFEQWKNAKPEHALAIQQAGQLTAGISALPPNFQPSAFADSKRKFNSLLQKNLLFSLCGLLAAGLVVYCLPWHKWQADYQTGIGEVRSYALQDGSKLILASGSYANVRFTENLREVELIEGEVYIETAKDQRKRPFFVETQYGSLEALGTQFTVLQDDESRAKVNVYQHAVAIHPRHQAQSRIIHQGHRAVFDSSRISKPIALTNQRPYWTQHLLVAENWPLKKVLHELYRYQKGTYMLDKDLQDIPVSGVFSLSDIPQSLEALAFSHQLQLSYYSPYLLQVHKK